MMSILFYGIHVRIGSIIFCSLKSFGLNPDDFKDLKWEDEPVEVFVNMED